jgi:hypothetical protein
MSHFTPRVLQPEKMGHLSIVVIVLGIVCTVVPILTCVSIDKEYFAYTAEEFLVISSKVLLGF